MKVPLGWLRDYIDIDITAEELADKLQSGGIPVEGIENRNEAGIKGVVVGQIVTLEKHPNADKLVVADVNVGNGKIQIVTGAMNVRQGDKVPVALTGSSLAGGVRIKKSNLRGLPSEGMMCSANELDLNIKDLPQEHREGVMVFPEDSPIGADVLKLLALDEPVLVIESFANRPDLLSISGIAAEAAAVLGKKLKKPSLVFPETDEAAGDIVKVEVIDKDLCPRYAARIIKDMVIKPSPLWMQGRLQAAGIRTISNVVDITNYVMLETGQPLHAFDYDLLKRGKIIVRRAKEGEKIITIDGEERSLTSSMLVIADAKKPVALAGVMGGIDTEISDSTGRILLESANFNGANIRRTSQALGIKSESSRRFEKGLDYYSVDIASDRASAMMVELGGKACKGRVEDGVQAPAPVNIALRANRTNSILGTEISVEDMAHYLEKLSFQVKVQGDILNVTVPSYRQDIKEEIDLVEEVARLYGYDNIPYTFPEGGGVVGRTTAVDKIESLCRDILARAGLYEVFTFTMASQESFEKVPFAAQNWLSVKNPLVEDQRILRGSLLYHLVEVASRNFRVKNFDVKIFELAKIYFPAEGFPEERRILSTALSGAGVDFYYAKGVMEAFFNELGIKYKFIPYEYPFFHPGQSAKILVNNEECGCSGRLNPVSAEKLDIEREIFLSEIYLDKIISLIPRKVYSSIPKFPSVERDIAMIVDEEIPASDIDEAIKNAGPEFLVKFECFDVYKGEQITPGKKSMAYSLAFQSMERTLTDEEVNIARKKICEALESKFGAKIRE